MQTTTKPNRGSPRVSNGHDGDRLPPGLRILIVEDVGMVAMALKTMLEEIGCKVVGTAARLPEAEELARHERLDGVLLDLNLGGQYSFPVVDILRERKIPFIIMSGYDAGQLRPDLTDEAIMPKPFEREPLERMLMKVFRGQGNGQSDPPRQPTSAGSGNQKSAQKTRGELESAVCLGMTRFEQEYMGRGPRDVQAYLIGDFLVVRLQGVLTAAEQHLAETLPPERGRDLLKQVRTQLIGTARKQIDSMIQVITGVRVRSLHHDISTTTGEEVVAFTLYAAPACRELKHK